MATVEIIIQTSDGATRPLRRIGTELRNLDRAASDAAKRGISALQSAVGVGLKAALAGIVTGLGGMVAAMAKSTSTSADLEQAIKIVGSKTEHTAGQLGELKDLAQELGTDDRYSVTTMQAAKAIELLGQNGVTATQILGGMGDATVLLNNATIHASRGIEGFALAGDILTDKMQIFGIETERAEDAVNGITAVVNNSKFGIDAYRLALGNGAAAAATAGVSFEDFNVALAGTASVFTSGQTAGTSFKTFMTRLIPTSKTMIAAFKELGLITADGTNNFYDSTGALRDMNEIVQILEESVSGLSEYDQTRLLKGAFGTEGMQAAIGMIQLGKQGFDELKATMAETSAVESAKQRMDNLHGSLSILGGVIETVKIGIGDKFLPIVKQVVQEITSTLKANADTIINFFGSIADKIDAAMPTITAAWESLKNSAAGFEQAWSSGWIDSQIIQPLTNAYNAVAGFVGYIQEAVFASVSWKDVLGALGIVIASVVIPGLVSIASAAAPVLAIGGALVVAVSELRNQWGAGFQGMENQTAVSLGRIAGFMQALASQAVAWGVGLVNALATGIRMAVGAIVQAINYIGSIIGGLMIPHSPPKFLPEIDKWGQGTAEAWLAGWQQADMSSLKQLAQRVDVELAGLTDQLAVIEPQIQTKDFANLSGPDRLQKLTELQGQEGLSDERKGQIALQIQEIQLQQRIARLARERAAMHEKMAKSANKLDMKPQVEAMKKMTSAVSSLATAMTKTETPQEKQLRSIRLQQAELNDLNELYRTQLILEDETASAAEKKAALLRQQAIEIQRQIRAGEAIELGVDLSGVQSISFEEFENPYEEQLKSLQLQQSEMADLRRLHELNQILADDSASAAEKKTAELQKQTIEIERQKRATQAEKAGIDLSGLESISFDEAKAAEVEDAYQKQIKAIQLKQAEIRDVLRLKELEAQIGDQSISAAERELAVLEKQRIEAEQTERAKQAAKAGVDLSGLSGLSTEGADGTESVNPLERQLKAVQMQQSEMGDLIELKRLQGVLEDENATVAEKKQAWLKMQTIELQRQLRAQEASELGVDLSSLQAVPIAFREMGTAGAKGLESIADGAAKGAGGLKDVLSGALGSAAGLDEIKASADAATESLTALPAAFTDPLVGLTGPALPVTAMPAMPAFGGALSSLTGEQAPIFDLGLGDIESQFSDFQESFSLGFEEGGEAFTGFSDSLREGLEELRENLTGFTDSLGLMGDKLSALSDFLAPLREIAMLIANPFMNAISQSITPPVPEYVEPTAQIARNSAQPEYIDPFAQIAQNMGAIDTVKGRMEEFRASLTPLLEALSGFATAIIGVGTAFATWQALSSIIPAVSSLASGGIVSGLSVAFGSLTGSLAPAAASLTALVGVLGGPLTLALAGGIAAVSAFAAAWATNAGGIREQLAPVFSWIEQGFEIIKGIAILVADRLMITFSAMGSSLAQTTPFWETLGAVLVGIGSVIASTVMPLLTGLVAVFSGVGVAVSGFAGLVVDVFALIASAIGNLIQGDFQGFLDSSTLIFSNMGTNITTIFSGLITAVVGLVGGLITSVVGFFQGLYNTLVGNSIVPDLVESIITYFTSLFDRGTQIVSDLYDSWVENWESMKETIRAFWHDAVSPILNDLRTIFTESLPNALTKLQSSWNTVFGKLKGYIEDVKKIFDDFWNLLKSFIDWVTGINISNPFEGWSMPSGGPAKAAGGVVPKAAGGLVFGGRAYLVGDGAGPELFLPRQSGRILPAGQTAQIMNQPNTNAAPMINLTIHAYGSDADTLAADIGRQLRPTLLDTARSMGW